MDLASQDYVNKVNQLAASVLADSRRRDGQFGHGKTARLGLHSEDLRRYSITRAIKTMLGKRTAGFEYECNQELRKRLYIPDGAFAVPTDALESRAMYPGRTVNTSAPAGLSFVDMYRAASVCTRLGVQRLDDLRDDVAIPRQITDAALAWTTPTGSVSASESSFGQISATPKTACAIAEVSEQLLKQSSADKIVMSGLAAVLAVGVDAAIISGTGGAQPLGILNTPGIGTASGTSLGYAGLVAVQKTIADATAILNPEALAYLSTPTVAEVLKGRQRFTGTDSPLWRGALHQGEIEGVQAVSSKQMPSATMLFGDWSTVYVGEWGPLLLRVDRGGTRFNQGLVGIRALWMVDVIPTAPAAFVKITGIT